MVKVRAVHQKPETSPVRKSGGTTTKPANETNGEESEMSEQIQCPLCGRQARPTDNLVPRPLVALASGVSCATCGEFVLDNYARGADFEKRRASGDYASLPAISAYTRRAQIVRLTFGHKYDSVPVILANSPPDTGGAPGTASLQDIWATWPSTMSERLDRALINLGSMSRLPGTRLKLHDYDYPVFYAEDPNVMGYVVWQLVESGYILREPDPATLTNRPGPLTGMAPLKEMDIVVTAEGWNRIADLERATAGQKPLQAFIAMWFSPEVQDALENGLLPGIQDAGYRGFRVDMKEHANKIDDEIIAEIRKCRFMVADFTGHRGGVYYEAGFAAGLGIPVIFTCRKDALEHLHFDVRQYNTIDWTSPEQLRQRLRNRIGAVIGPPPPAGQGT